MAQMFSPEDLNLSNDLPDTYNPHAHHMGLGRGKIREEVGGIGCER